MPCFEKISHTNFIVCTILVILSRVSIQWNDFYGLMNAAGYTFWDVLSIVSEYLIILRKEAKVPFF